MYSNRGRRLLGQAESNEVLPGGRVRKNDVEYESVQTLFLDSAFSSGTFKGFFGRVSMDTEVGGILRLGVVWGDSSSKVLHTTVAEAAPVYDVDAISFNALEEERDQARKDAAKAREDMNRERADINRKVEEEVKKRKQITFGNGAYSSRQSVSFKGESLVALASETPFLTFENGTNFKYKPDGNLVIYSGSGNVLWTTTVSGTGATKLFFYGGNDGNLVSWKSSGGYFWASETRDCRNGFLVLSSESPYIEIFKEDGVRRYKCP